MVQSFEDKKQVALAIGLIEECLLKANFQGHEAVKVAKAIDFVRNWHNVAIEQMKADPAYALEEPLVETTENTQES